MIVSPGSRSTPLVLGLQWVLDQQAADAGDALRAHVVEANFEPCKGADMGNARPHLSGANDADFADFHLGFLIKSIQKCGKA